MQEPILFQCAEHLPLLQARWVFLLCFFLEQLAQTAHSQV